ncbi:MAG: LON peptidase substrate-binding domain-containing protein, partial [Erysipelotrichaceae bacterium]|nr:LON peptidase substrate-binding domain-containing protein [Erysipelotrichaceae bacterium]
MDEKNRDRAIIEADFLDLPMIPLRGLSVFPNMVLHFDIGREKSINALEKAMVNNQYVFLSSQLDENTDLPTTKDFYQIGTIAKIKQMLKLPGDAIRVLVEGICRGRIADTLFEVPYFKCRVEPLPDKPGEVDSEAEALMRTVLGSFDEYININQNMAPEIFATVVTIDSPGRMADMIASHLEIKIEDKQAVLELLDQKERLKTLNDILIKEIEILNIEQDISSKVKDQINQNQREYYLREQMRAIQEELGGDESIEDEVAGYREQLAALELDDKTRDKVEKEISRFSKMQPSSAEATVSRTYIETVLELPWNTMSEDNIDLVKAER